MNQKEKLFFDQLKDIFIGAKIEGESGFINLMGIKSAYFGVIFRELSKEIEQKTREFPDFKEEMFDKLYTFFKTYFSESGSIYFSYTPLKSKVYERIYSPDKDVMLFWKTHILYYVKTDRLWNNLTIDFDEDGVKYKINFDVSKLQHKKANEKGEIIYELKEINDKEITFNVLYSEKGRKTKIDEILRTFKKKNIHLDEERLLKLFRTYEKQNEVDYFINKNAEQFLKEQFDLWLKNYLVDDESDFSEKRLKQLKVLKEIAYKVINFVAQFEDEPVKIWNKPKFVLNSNYVITLDRIAKKDGGIELIEKILEHKDFEEQKKEWKELGILEDFDKSKLFINTLNGKELSKECQFLPIDTRYFDEDIKLELLSLFDDLDKELDGWLIHSENYQALKTILPKFKEKVQTIYIDPPYNTGSDEFVYKDRFRHSSWLTMLENRLDLAKNFLNDNGVFYSNIDDNEVDEFGILTKTIFEGKTDKIIWKKASEGRWGKMKNVKTFRKDHEYIIVAFEGEEKLNKILEKPRFVHQYGNPDNDPRGPYKAGSISTKEEASDPDHPNYYTVVSPSGKKFTRQWDVSKGEFERLNKDGRIYWGPNGNNVPAIKIFLNEEREITPYSVLIEKGTNTEAKEEFIDILGPKVREFIDVLNPKPTKLLETLFQLSTDESSIVFDFFAGSGTAAHAAMKLNKKYGGKRKFILVEMGEYFDTIICPRIKKIAYSFNWKSGKPQDTDGIGIFFKYYDLEQYEQTLRKAVYKPSHPFVDFDDKSIYQQYVFMKDLKLLGAMKLDYENNKVRINFEEIYPNIDLAETLSNLTGRWIKKIEKDAVVFEDGSRIDFDNIDFNLIKPSIWW